jgi:hypothetical protein
VGKPLGRKERVKKQEKSAKGKQPVDDKLAWHD